MKEKKTGITQLRIFWGEQHREIEKKLYQELVVVYSILL
jgi:hypothetical protein